ncbi:MAG: glycosyltransferase family 2 protein [Acidobacteriota bacterium]|nr:glycosyltransferase family 2 protein [Acidobacteriota bacterium]
MTNYDLAVAYRIYPKVSRPALGLPFSDDKLRLSEICLRSLKESLGNLRAKIWVVLDGCPEDYASLFSKYFDAQDLALLRLPGVGNRATFSTQLDILLKQTDSDIVYFAEDDYLYLPNHFHRMIDFLRSNNDVHFISPYDHLDCYTCELHRFPKWIRVHANHHWRTAASTCLTFLTRKSTLQKKQLVFRTYTWRNHDCSLWLSLTKHALFDPLEFMRYAAREPLFAKMITKSWLYGWPQILFGTRMKLWVPVPAFATHLDSNALSPATDWITMMNGLGSSDGQTASASREQPIDQSSLHLHGRGR